MKEQDKEEKKEVSFRFLCCLAILLGALTGLCSFAFKTLIILLHNFFFLTKFSFYFVPEAFIEPSSLGPLIILVPVVGGLIVVFLVERFAPEARGHGVPEVIDSIYYSSGKIRPITGLIKSIASALSIGSGAAVGQEGPVIQIAASLGSTIGDLKKVVPWQRITLLAAGAGAGIAATFNTPIGGVLFALEVILPEMSTRTFLPVLLATGTATYVGHALFGSKPLFLILFHEVPTHLESTWGSIAAFLFLGILCGLASWAFIVGLEYAEEKFSKIFRNPYLRHAVGMFFVGVIIYILMVGFGHYFVAGSGFPTVQHFLMGENLFVGLLIVLFIAELISTVLSLGSGASGGIFSPSLFLGACLGSLLGVFLQFLFPDAGFSTIHFAIAGMAGVVGGATGAAMTAICMVYEMSQDYMIVFYMIWVVAISILTRRMLTAENIYTIKLLKRGHKIPRMRKTYFSLLINARELMKTNPLMLPHDIKLREAVLIARGSEAEMYVLCDKATVYGVGMVESLFNEKKFASPDIQLSEWVSNDCVFVQKGDILEVVLKKMNLHNADSALVVEKTKPYNRPDEILGIITKNAIGEAILVDFKN